MRRNWYRVGFVKGFQILSWRDGYVFSYDTTRQSSEKFRPTILKLLDYMEQEMMTKDKAKDFIKDLNIKLHDQSIKKNKEL